MLEEVLNTTDILSVLPPEIADSLGGLIIILKAVGIAFIVYVIYLLFTAILNIKRSRRIKRIEKKLDLVMDKLNIKDPKKKDKDKKKDKRKK